MKQSGSQNLELKMSMTARGMSLLSVVAMISIASGCSKSLSHKDLVFVNTTQAQELVQGKPRLLGLAGTEAGTYIDCRPEADFKTGHIPGAVNLPYERVSIDHKTLNELDILIVYGDDYNDNRAEGMSKRLMELGHDDVRTLTGGLRAWKSEGNPVETQ